MTRLKDSTFEGGSLTGTDGATTTVGTVNLETTAPIKGTYSANVSLVSSYARYDFTAIDTVFISAYVKVTTFANQRFIYFVNTSTGQCSLQFRTTGKVRLTNAAGTQIGSDSTLTMTAGNVYRVGMRYTKGTGANGIVEAFVAANDDAFGAAFASTSAGDGTLQINRIQLGNTTSTNAANFIFDNARIDDASMPGPDGNTNTPIAVSVTATVTNAITKGVGKPLGFTSSITSALNKAINKTLSITETVTTTIQKAIPKTISIASSVAIAFTKGFGYIRNISIPITTTVTLQKPINKIISAAISTTTSLQKKINKTIQRNISTTVSVIFGNVYQKTITVAISTSLFITRNITRSLLFTGSTVITLRKNISKNISTTVITLASTSKGYFRTFVTTISSVITNIREFIPAGIVGTRPISKNARNIMIQTQHITISLLKKVSSLALNRKQSRSLDMRIKDDDNI